MELFEASSHYIVQEGMHALWCSRETGALEARDGSDILHVPDPLCLGIVHNVIGRVQVGSDLDCNWLLLVSKQTEVGLLPGGHPIFRIDNVVFLPLTHSANPFGAEASPGGLDPTVDAHMAFEESIRELLTINLQKCPKHSNFRPMGPNLSNDSGVSTTTNVPNMLSVPAAAAGGVFKRTFSNFLSTGSSTVESSTRYRRPESRTARRVIESLDKLFNDSPSFYYSPSADITASTWCISRNVLQQRESLVADDRFFFNKALLIDLLKDESLKSSYWIVPIIQGFVQFERIAISPPDSADSPSAPAKAVVFQKQQDNVTLPPSGIDLYIGIISRRSRHRAGTRYKKRGADQHGFCANYVETEQILYWHPHWCSYVIVRGSVPLFWSQSGIQYRPPPKLEKTSTENVDVFAMHFEREISRYQHVSVVNLLHQSSKEEALCNAFTENALIYNSPSLTYISFDFNEHCRGMRFENVLILTQNIENIIQESSFTWIDGTGVVCEQSSVFRVNCLDCLDRTNIVEAAISRVVLEYLCGKMGIVNPDAPLPTELLRIFKVIWANNGDALSRQYAGTNALKGDYTRTGEHGVTAALKDGFNSANRYYLNQFQDAARQAAIDICLGKKPVFSDKTILSGSAATAQGILTPSSSSQNLQVFQDTQESLQAKCENLLATMEDVRKMLLTEEDLCLGSWLLFDSSDSSVTNDCDFDVILILSMNSIFIVRLDVEGDPIFYYEIPLSTIVKAECGPLAVSGGSILPFKKARKTNGIKINYRPRVLYNEISPGGLTMDRSSEYCFVFRTANFRLFSGVLIPVENDSDSREVLTMICECFRNVTGLSGVKFPINELPPENSLRFDRKKAARIDSHPNKIMWADSSQTMQAFTMESPTTMARQSQPRASRNIFDKTIKSFSNLLKNSPSAQGDFEQNPISQPDQIHLQFSANNSSVYKPALNEEWKREILRRMPVCNTRIIQL